MKLTTCVILSIGLLATTASYANNQIKKISQHWTVPGTVRTTWIGNSFKGDSNSHVLGEFVQNTIDEIEVMSDGTVLTASTWDENGKTVSLYKDGKTGINKFRQYEGRGGHKVWGWGTASLAVAYAGEHIFVANINGDLLRFQWEPGKLDTQKYLDQTRYAPGDTHTDNKLEERGLTAIGLSARENQLVLLRKDGIIQVWKDIHGDIKLSHEFKVENTNDLALDHKLNFWVIKGQQVLKMTDTGQVLASIDDAGLPSAVAVSPQGYVVICDDGPRQQVRVYDVSGEPKLIKTYGREGGLRASNPPGKLEPDIFYSLRGANYDKEGNLYVAFSMGQLANGAGTTLRSYAANSNYKIRWDLKCLAFVDCFAVDPGSDGKLLYSSQEIVSFNPDAPDGENWLHIAMTVDPITYPKERRDAGGIQFQRVNGRRLMAWLSQYEGVNLYAFQPNSQIARPVYGEDGKFHDKGWGWHLDEEGSLWSSDAGGDKIQRWKLQGWDNNEMPIYNKENPEEWQRPKGWESLMRIFYEPKSDTLYLTGFTSEYPSEKGWGMVGRVAVRYDNWTSDKRRIERWCIKNLPKDSSNLPPKTFTVAGDYVFFGACQPSKTEENSSIPLMVHVYRKDNGKYVGNIWCPIHPVGWMDTRQAMNVLKRSNGQYIIIVEEVYRGKNLVHIWIPPEANQ